MIRSSLKSGLKKLADRVLGAPVPAAAPPAPAWKTAPAASPTVPAKVAPAVAPVVARSPVNETVPPVTAAPAPSTVEAAPPPEILTSAALPEPPADVAATRAKKAGKGAAAKRSRAEDTVARLQDTETAEAAPVEPATATPSASVVVTAPARADDVVGPALSMEALQEVIDEMVRPALQGDGGDITLLRIEGGKVYVKLVGACSTCPSSIATLKLGVEALLKEEFPAIEEVVQEA